MTREKAIAVIRKNYPHVGFSGTEFETALRELIPELAESEDERIREELIGHCKDLVRKNQDDKVMLSIYEPWLAYLERQKDSPMPEDTVIFQKGVDEGRRLEREDMEKERLPIIETYQRSWYTEGYYDGKLKKEPRWIIKTQGICTKYEENPKYGQSLEEEQKPEWSEEDEKMVMTIISDGIRGIELDSKQVDWLKSLKNRGNFLKSNTNSLSEWNVNDESAFGDLMWCIEQARKSATVDDMGNVWYAEKWLKNRLKSLRPQPSWKPSEEQMKALKVSNSYWQGLTKEVPKTNELESLYNDLKKLM